MHQCIQNTLRFFIIAARFFRDLPLKNQIDQETLVYGIMIVLPFFLPFSHS